MLGVSDIASIVFVAHNVIGLGRDKDVFCDAPKLVRIGIGFNRRTVYLARAAASDACVQNMLVEHSAKHAKAEEDLVDTMIGENSDAFRSKLVELKHTPASSVDMAKAHSEAGGRELVRKILNDLVARRAWLHQSIDTEAEITRLRSSCSRRLRALDMKTGI